MEIVDAEGVAGLYSGIESALFGIAITQAVYYYCYERAKGVFDATVVGTMASGALAGSITSLVTNPIWVINVSLILLLISRGSYWLMLVEPWLLFIV